MELTEIRASSRTADRAEALEALVDACGDGVLHLAYFYLKDRAMAEDVFQEVFTKVYMQGHTFRGESSPKTWIYRITVNLCRDKLRAWAFRKVSLIGEEMLNALRPAAPDTADEVLDRADRSVLLEAVMRLPVEYREVVHLYYYEELDVREVALALGLSDGTIRSRLFRARGKLRVMLQEGGFTHDGE
jgi:RNA polymerase sigma-70 factor, ECF subfamily